MSSGADKRKFSRYSINPAFPVKTMLSLMVKGSGSPPPGKVTLRAGGTHWKDWPATLVDLSASGANVHVNLAAVAFPEDPCRLKLSLGSYQIEIPCTVAHFVTFTANVRCGVQFNFPDDESEKAFMQILEPIMIGTSLALVESKTDTAGRTREVYGGRNMSSLTVTRQQAGGELTSFDFKLNRFGVKWSAGLTELTTYAVEDERASNRPALKLKLKVPEKGQSRPPSALLTEAQDEEVRWLFCLAVYNLSLAVAADVREFLLSIVVA